MTAYIDHIDLTQDGKVVVTGLLSRTNLEASLTLLMITKPPQDGIWTLNLDVFPTSMWGVYMMVPFRVESPWGKYDEANGIRIIQRSLEPSHSEYETNLLKIKKVDDFTDTQINDFGILGGVYDEVYNQLIIDVQYSGGCFPHLYSLEWDGQTIKEAGLSVFNFRLVDLSKEDTCKAIKRTQLRFDIDTSDVQFDKHRTQINLETIFGRQLQIDINKNKNQNLLANQQDQKLLDKRIIKAISSEERIIKPKAYLNLEKQPPTLKVEGTIITPHGDDVVELSVAEPPGIIASTLLLNLKVISGSEPMKGTPKKFNFELSNEKVVEYNHVQIIFYNGQSVTIEIEKE